MMSKELHERCATLLLGCHEATRGWDTAAHRAVDKVWEVMLYKYHEEYGGDENPYGQVITLPQQRIYRDQICEALSIFRDNIATNYTDSQRRRKLFQQIDKACTATLKALALVR